jgi:hypothetical protein
VQAAVVCLALIAPRAEAMSDLARADAYWAKRAEGQVDAKAKPAPINAALDGYRAASRLRRTASRYTGSCSRRLSGRLRDADPERRALSTRRSRRRSGFRCSDARAGGSFTSATPERWARRSHPRPQRRGTVLWSAINRAWSRLAGLLRRVHGRRKPAARVDTALDRSISVEQGGGIRLLSRLHPSFRVPLLRLGRSRAVPLAERALTACRAQRRRVSNALAPHAHRPQALHCSNAPQSEPRPDHVIEDEAIRISAREDLPEVRRA